MKKFIRSFVFLIVIFSIIGCRSEKKKISVSDVLPNFSVYSLLPKSLLDNTLGVKEVNIDKNTNSSEIYRKLLMNYHYIEDLFKALNEVFENAVDEENINHQERYVYNQYEFYAISNHKNSESIEVFDTLTGRKLTVNVTTLANSNKLYSGTHKVNSDTFTYEFVNNKEMLIKYSNENMTTQAKIIKDDEFVRTHISYITDKSNYQIYSISNEAFSTIYYEYQDSVLDKSFEIFDGYGNLIYQSFSINDGIYQASGWHLKPINIESIKKIENNLYLVNGILFENIPGETNFYEISCKYVDEEYYLFGQLSFNENITKIIDLRTPFETDKYDIITNLAKETLEYYRQVNNK